jgi:hypothetical protein
LGGGGAGGTAATAVFTTPCSQQLHGQPHRLHQQRTLLPATARTLTSSRPQTAARAPTRRARPQPAPTLLRLDTSPQPACGGRLRSEVMVVCVSWVSEVVRSTVSFACAPRTRKLLAYMLCVWMCVCAYARARGRVAHAAGSGHQGSVRGAAATTRGAATGPFRPAPSAAGQRRWCEVSHDGGMAWEVCVCGGGWVGCVVWCVIGYCVEPDGILLPRLFLNVRCASKHGAFVATGAAHDAATVVLHSWLQRWGGRRSRLHPAALFASAAVCVAKAAVPAVPRVGVLPAALCRCVRRLPPSLPRRAAACRGAEPVPLLPYASVTFSTVPADRGPFVYLKSDNAVASCNKVLRGRGRACVVTQGRVVTLAGLLLWCALLAPRRALARAPPPPSHACCAGARGAPSAHLAPSGSAPPPFPPAAFTRSLHAPTAGRGRLEGIVALSAAHAAPTAPRQPWLATPRATCVASLCSRPRTHPVSVTRGMAAAGVLHGAFQPRRHLR